MYFFLDSYKYTMSNLVYYSILTQQCDQSLSCKIYFFFPLEGDTAAGALCNLPVVSCCLMLLKPFALAHATQARMQPWVKVEVLIAEQIF